MRKTDSPSGKISILHVKTLFVPALEALREQAGVTREHAVNQALRDFFLAYVPANYPNVKLPKEVQAILKGTA